MSLYVSFFSYQSHKVNSMKFYQISRKNLFNQELLFLINKTLHNWSNHDISWETLCLLTFWLTYKVTFLSCNTILFSLLYLHFSDYQPHPLLQIHLVSSPLHESQQPLCSFWAPITLEFILTPSRRWKLKQWLVVKIKVHLRPWQGTKSVRDGTKTCTNTARQTFVFHDSLSLCPSGWRSDNLAEGFEENSAQFLLTEAFLTAVTPDLAPCRELTHCF